MKKRKPQRIPREFDLGRMPPMRRKGDDNVVKFFFRPLAFASLLCLGLLVLYYWTPDTTVSADDPTVVSQQRCPPTPEPITIVRTVVATSPAVVVTRQVIVEVTRTVEQTVMATVIHTSTPDAKVVEEYQSMHEELDALDLKLEQDKRDLEFAQTERNANLKFVLSVALAIAVLLFVGYILIILARMLRNHPVVVDAIDNAKEWYEEEQEPEVEEIFPVAAPDSRADRKPTGTQPTQEAILKFYEAASRANSLSQIPLCKEWGHGGNAWTEMRNWLASAEIDELIIINGRPQLRRGTLDDMVERYRKSTAPPP